MSPLHFVIMLIVAIIILTVLTLKCCGYDGMVSVETFRPEYWAKTPEWVIENAYRTTYAALEKNQCL